MLRKFLPIILLSLGTLLQASPASLHALILSPDGLVPARIPNRVSSLPSITQADLNLDGLLEKMTLAGGRLSILSKGSPVWQSPPAWEVVQASFSELDGDGRPEVTILLWRPYSPWPVDQWLPNGGRISTFQNAQGLSCHIILVGWKRSEFQEIWAGSAMADPIASFTTADLDGDNKQEMASLEGYYSDSKSNSETRIDPTTNGILKVWKWNGFGFTAVSSTQGVFGQVSFVQTPDRKLFIFVP
jgi:hypothetical protein